MGLIVSEWTFENQLPKVKDVKQKFWEITGLRLFLSAELNLVELVNDVKTVVELLHEEFEKYTNDLNKIDKSKSGWFDNIPSNGMDSIELSCFGFEGVNFDIKSGKTIILNYFVGQYYFPECLNRAFFELGGTFYFGKEIELNDKTIKRWKKLKPWKQYKWYNRPRK